MDKSIYNLYDVIVIGGGPAGMAAALEVKKTGASVLIIEREKRLGGILNQCIHNGFGLHYFKEELTGPEYANRFIKLIEEEEIDYVTNTFVTEVNGKEIKYVSPDGAGTINPKAIIFAMGCREKTAGSIRLNGSRPAGVLTAGQAQKLVNYFGKLPGERVVILGSGDIGLIMARRLTYQGAKVEKVLEIMPSSSGLQRNIRQCLEDNNIPIYYNTTITEVIGKDRVEGIKYAEVDKNLNVIKETEKFMECDCVILSVGLAPDNDIVKNIKLNSKTSGFVVNEFREMSEGIFACGNVLQVHDLVDNVSNESALAGKNAGLYALGKLERGKECKITAGEGVSYVSPNSYFENDGKLDLYFRVTKKFGLCEIVIKNEDKELYTKTEIALAPGEMVSLKIDKQNLQSDIIVSIREK